jgi:hypothetical protein
MGSMSITSIDLAKKKCNGCKRCTIIQTGILILNKHCYIHCSSFFFNSIPFCLCYYLLILSSNRVNYSMTDSTPTTRATISEESIVAGTDPQQTIDWNDDDVVFQYADPINPNLICCICQSAFRDPVTTPCR